MPVDCLMSRSNLAKQIK
uniref:Uncharacterized protein n=1 Tax=Arundo donax TaxID=35708 RepID=A0A0A9GZ13_ARUDO